MALIDYASAEGDAYHRERHKEFFESPALTEAWAAFIHRVYFPDLPRGATVLEVGAGLGTNLLSIKSIADVYAVEPAQAAREQCEQHGLRSFSKLEALPADVRFDYILIRHVLEHVQDPRAMLLEVRGLLKPAGQLIVALPSEPPFAKPDPDDIDHHLFSWNRQTIANLLTDCGYTVVEARLNWRNGRRLFLPLYRLFGTGAYAFALRALGWVRRYCEIVVVAKSKP
jgi:2-polyprenyl-3-methyl-5-hydroxy-6-metoxy-1,4-benzoquinol methylase